MGVGGLLAVWRRVGAPAPDITVARHKRMSAGRLGFAEGHVVAGPQQKSRLSAAPIAHTPSSAAWMICGTAS